jgi:hypothetical protein
LVAPACSMSVSVVEAEADGVEVLLAQRLPSQAVAA